MVRSCLFSIRKSHRHKVQKIVTKQIDDVKVQSEKILTSKGNESPGKKVLESPPINLPDVTPEQLKNLTGTHTPSPPSGNSDTPSSDSETPVSVPMTAELQLEKTRQDRERQKDICIIA